MAEAIIRRTLTRESQSGRIVPAGRSNAFGQRERLMRHVFVGFLALTFGLVPAAVGASDEGLDLGHATNVTVTGHIFDEKTKAPLAQSQVRIDGSFETKRGIAGPDGTYAATATSATGLGVVSVVFSHSAYQEKYLDSILREAFRGDVEARVAKGSVQLRARKVDLSLACDGRAEISTKTLGSSSFHVICEGDRSGVEFEVRGTTIAVLAAGSFTLRIRNGSLEVRDATSENLELRIDAAMYPR